MNSFLKFKLLLWKNYLVQKRKPIGTGFGIGLPTMFALILMLVRLKVSSDPIDHPTQWDPCRNYEELSLFTLMKIAYSPKNNATDRIMERVQEKLKLLYATEGFPDEDSMVSYITLVKGNKNNSQIYLGGIAFQSDDFKSNDTQFNQHISYKIRLSYAPRNPSFKDKSWLTNFLFPPFQKLEPREQYFKCGGPPGYYEEGFLAIQGAVNNALMKDLVPEKKLETYDATEILLQRQLYPPYKKDQYVLVLQRQYPFIILLSLIVTVLLMVKEIVIEKERRLKESMKMMGINNWLHWSAWFTKHFLFLLISVIIMTIFYCVPIDKEKGGVIDKSNPFIVFLFFICYVVSSITYSFAVSVFFTKANTGAAVGGILFFCLQIPYYFIQPNYSTMTYMSKVLACLDFQVAMSFGGTLLGQFEGQGVGIQFDNLANGVAANDEFSMLLVLVMLLFDSLIHCLITWYVEAVFPGEYGAPQPWYFPVLPNYWGCCSKRVEHIDLSSTTNVGQDPDMFEKELSTPVGVQIRNLRKVYSGSGKKKVAVAGMTLNMYEGQITALLGHNGAGKTTTMSMLSGFYAPTSGTAVIDGYDIREEMPEIRDRLGLCPQHDILFDNLTVEEHMKFFSLLKGVPSKQVMEKCKEMLKDMELYPKLKAMAKTLSGGMKRKLSVCIALIGDSKIVFLDEPSSGLDPNARRNIWTVLQKNRTGRTMVLSTHFMDEADLLGDRIAIMSGGIVRCCGSSLFLKKKFGAGYHMVVVKNANCDINSVIGLVTSHIPSAKLESNVGAELSFILPQESVGNFEVLFTEMEQRQENLGISSFGASVTTMEEVFLKVGESEDFDMDMLKQHHNSNANGTNYLDQGNKRDSTSNIAHSDAANNYNGNLSTSSQANLVLCLDDESPQLEDFDPVARMEKNSGPKLWQQQFYAMFVKRVLHSLRNKLVTVTQIAVPLTFTILGLLATKVRPSYIDTYSLKLVPESYGSNYIPFIYDNQSLLSKEMAFAYANQFQGTSTSTVDVNSMSKNMTLIEYLTEKGKEALGIYNTKYMFSSDFNHTAADNKTTVTAYFNNQGYHCSAISLAATYNGLLQYFTNDDKAVIETYNHPLPRLTVNKVSDELGLQNPEGFIISSNLAFGMAFLASSFVVFLVRERESKAKHIQFVSGVHPVNFWISTFFWDMINYMLPCLCLMVVFVAFSIDPYLEDLHWLHIIFFFILYGWGMLPSMYLLSFAFNVPATAYVWITMFNILTAVATQLVVVILTIPSLGLVDVSNMLEWIFIAIFPNFNLSQGLFLYYQNKGNIELCETLFKIASTFSQANCSSMEFAGAAIPCCPNLCNDECVYFNHNYLGWEKSGIGRMLIFLALQGCMVWAFIFTYEFGYIQKLRYMLSFNSNKSNTQLQPRNLMSQMSVESVIEEDEDVVNEKHRINSTPKEQLFQTDKLILNKLTKYYGKFCAVDHLSVGIASGECFGLLGINGAGKTSTFMMLTGDSIISSGEAYLESHSLKTEKGMARKKLGYCPQFDALIGQLTGRETLFLFARLRGVVESQIPRSVEYLMKALTLTPYADNQCRTYSGGNMRKLSTAIALVGDPDVVFLDEPTTGMDPAARRMLWLVLSKVRDNGRTLVLTSHSMEECEALCTRLAIMVNGQFKCLGSTQHLKTKFGEGYTFIAKVAFPEDGGDPELGPIQEFLASTFQHCKLIDIHENMVNYHIVDTQVTWAQVFGLMERAKERLNIEDYLVSQTTLEQVFITFARNQKSSDIGDEPDQKEQHNSDRTRSPTPKQLTPMDVSHSAQVVHVELLGKQQTGQLDRPCLQLSPL